MQNHTSQILVRSLRHILLKGHGGTKTTVPSANRSVDDDVTEALLAQALEAAGRRAIYLGQEAKGLMARGQRAKTWN